MTGAPLDRRSRTALLFAGLVSFCLVFVAELALSVRQQSQTWDEAYHLLAGLRYGQDSDFGINSEHPPLAKLLASLPLLPLRLDIPALPQGTSKLEGFVAARKFLYANDAGRLLFRSRMAVSLLALILALLVFEATHRMFGAGPAFLALSLVVFEPNLLAHGTLVTTDAAMTCTLFATVYAFYRYAREPSAWKLVACGLMAGLVLPAKHSGIVVFLVLAFLAAAEILFVPKPAPAPQADPAKNTPSRWAQTRRLAIAMLLIGAIAVATLWAFYGFRFQARPRGLRMTPPLERYLAGENPPGLSATPLQKLVFLRLARWRLLPESYLYGMADVLIVSTGPRPSFLFGKLYPQGQWFYFPAVFVIKTTLGLLLLFLLGVGSKFLRESERRREVLFLVIPPALYLAMSLTSRLNVGVRHILPLYPFVIVLAAAGAWGLAKTNRRWLYVVAGLAAFHVFSSLRAFPDYLAYSNELWGGPSKTYRVLTDSNVDNGQGLIAVKRYLDDRRITDCWLAYFGSADPDYYKIPCRRLPGLFDFWWGKPVVVVPRQLRGTLLIAATEASGAYWGAGELNPYGEFLNRPPAELVGHSVLVFKGEFDLSTASAWSRLNRAWELFAAHQVDQALSEAQEVVKFAPRMVYAHYTLGYLLLQKKQVNDARREFETALSLARTIYPEYQWYWVPFLTQLIR